MIIKFNKYKYSRQAKIMHPVDLKAGLLMRNTSSSFYKKTVAVDNPGLYEILLKKEKGLDKSS